MSRPFFPYPSAKVDRLKGPELAAFETGRRRCVGMLKLWGILQTDTPTGRVPDMLGLLASCYLQGVRDTAEALKANGWKMPEEETKC